MNQPAPTEITIELDRVHRAIRSGSRWAVQRHLPDGSWDAIDAWDGGRRSLFHWMEQRGIAPTRDAEAKLSLLPESTGWRDR